MSSELASLRAYVTDPAGRAGLAQASSTVLLNVEHASLKAKFAELRLDKHVRVFKFFGRGPRGRNGCAPLRSLSTAPASAPPFSAHAERLCRRGHGA